MPLRAIPLVALSAALLAALVLSACSKGNDGAAAKRPDTVALLAAAPASATTAEEAVQFLNKQREANQIPAGLAVDADRTKGCKNHNHYMSLNGGLQHGEQPGNPGYTDEGATIAVDGGLTV